MCAPNTAAAELSGRCQHLLRVGDRLGKQVAEACADGNPLHIGDIIQTRRNTSELATSDASRVLNRDVWRITGGTRIGDIRAVSLNRRATVMLTKDYVDEHVVLAYATTIAGAQGRTTDTGHVLVTPATTSNSLYVGMTRGKRRNTARVVTDGHDHEEFGLGDRTPADAFAAAIMRDGTQRSAHAVRAQWEAETPARRAARLRDQQHRAVVNWWGRARVQLPSAIQASN